MPALEISDHLKSTDLRDTTPLTQLTRVQHILLHHKEEGKGSSVNESRKHVGQNGLVAVEYNKLLILLRVYTIIAVCPRKIITTKIKALAPKIPSNPPYK